MITYNNIRDAVIAKVKALYQAAGIYGEEIQQGYTRPAFYIQLLPEAGLALSGSNRQKQLLVNVHYFSAAQANIRERDMWNVADELDYTFGNYLLVGDRSLYIKSTEPDIEDGVLQYKLNLSWVDGPDNAIEITLDDGTETVAVPEPELGYTDGNVLPMRNLTLKEE